MAGVSGFGLGGTGPQHPDFSPQAGDATATPFAKPSSDLQEMLGKIKELTGKVFQESTFNTPIPDPTGRELRNTLKQGALEADPNYDSLIHNPDFQRTYDHAAYEASFLDCMQRAQQAFAEEDKMTARDLYCQALVFAEEIKDKEQVNWLLSENKHLMNLYNTGLLKQMKTQWEAHQKDVKKIGTQIQYDFSSIRTPQDFVKARDLLHSMRIRTFDSNSFSAQTATIYAANDLVNPYPIEQWKSMIDQLSQFLNNHGVNIKPTPLEQWGNSEIAVYDVKEQCVNDLCQAIASDHLLAVELFQRLQEQRSFLQNDLERSPKEGAESLYLKKIQQEISEFEIQIEFFRPKVKDLLKKFQDVSEEAVQNAEAFLKEPDINVKEAQQRIKEAQQRIKEAQQRIKEAQQRIKDLGSVVYLREAYGSQGNEPILKPDVSYYKKLIQMKEKVERLTPAQQEEILKDPDVKNVFDALDCAQMGLFFYMVNRGQTEYSGGNQLWAAIAKQHNFLAVVDSGDVDIESYSEPNLKLKPLNFIIKLNEFIPKHQKQLVRLLTLPAGTIAEARNLTYYTPVEDERTKSFGERHNVNTTVLGIALLVLVIFGALIAFDAWLGEKYEKISDVRSFGLSGQDGAEIPAWVGVGIGAVIAGGGLRLHKKWRDSASLKKLKKAVDRHIKGHRGKTLKVDSKKAVEVESKEGAAGYLDRTKVDEAEKLFKSMLKAAKVADARRIIANRDLFGSVMEADLR